MKRWLISLVLALMTTCTVGVNTHSQSYEPTAMFSSGNIGSKVVEHWELLHQQQVDGARRTESTATNMSTKVRSSVVIAEQILAGHFSGTHGKNDRYPFQTSQVVEVRIAELCHSREGHTEDARFENDPKCVQYMLSGGAGEYSFGTFTSVVLLGSRRGRSMRASVQFKTNSHHHQVSDQSAVEKSLLDCHKKPNQLACQKGSSNKESAEERTVAEEYENNVASVGVSVTTVFPRRTATVAQDASSSTTEDRATTEGIGSSPKPNTKKIYNFKLLNYNVWNFNADWKYRCRRIANIIKEQAADIVTLQEVRYDSTRSDHEIVDVSSVRAMQHGPKGYRYKFHSQAQTEHLMRHIRTKTPYSYFFHPAMTYFHTKERVVRYETEGPMILQRFHSVVANVPFLLTRKGVEAGDDHQRLMLCSVVLLAPSELAVEGNDKPRAIPLAEAITPAYAEANNFLRIDVCTAHFALSPQARMLNAEDALRHMETLSERQHDFNRNGHHDGVEVCPQHVNGAGDGRDNASTGCFDLPNIPKAHITIFTGDLNAEPDDAAIQLIADTPRSGFQDFFVEVEELRRQSGGVLPLDKDKKKRKESIRPAHHDHGLTFNNNDHGPLSKRIDYIFVKNRRPEKLAIQPQSLEHLGHRDHSAKSTAQPASDHLALLAKMKFVESE